MPDDPRGNILSLAIETSSRRGSVALYRGRELLETAVFSAELRHAVELLPQMDTLCRRHGAAPSDIEEVYVSAGPGSFTGLRIGITVARTLAWANGVRVVRVPTLEVISQNALELPDPPDPLIVLLDAKRGNSYAGVFRRVPAGYKPMDEPAERAVERLAESLPPGTAVIGEGIAYHREAVDRAGWSVLPEPLHAPRAEAVHRLGWARSQAGTFDDPAGLIPIYVRRPEAEEVWERRHGTASVGC